MSNPVSALQGAAYDGYVKVEETGLRGMITVRGNLASTKLKNAVKAATGAAMPKQRQISIADEGAVAWMSPDELLLLVAYDKVNEVIAAFEEAMAGQHFLAVNVSDARAMFRLSGDKVREVIAKISPVDMAQGEFNTGDFRRTRMAQIPAAFWMADEQTVEIICFRSVADYAYGLLKDAAEPGGEIDIFG